MAADVLLMDDRDARREALNFGLRVAGAISILDEADQAGLIDFGKAIADLQKTSFRVLQKVILEI